MNAKNASNDVGARLAGAALRGILAEVDQAPELAGEVLARLLGTGAPVGGSSAPPVGGAPPGSATAPAPPAPGEHAAQRRRSGKKRPRPAAKARPAPQADPATKAKRARPDTVPGFDLAAAEAQQLVAKLLESCGTAKAIAERHGLREASVGRWRLGKAITPGSLERLRGAVAAERDRALRAEVTPPTGPSGFRGGATG